MDLEKYLKTISIRWFFERTRRAGLSLLLLGVCTSLGCAWRPSFPDLSDLKLPKMPAIKLPKLPDLNPFNDDVGGPSRMKPLELQLLRALVMSESFTYGRPLFMSLFAIDASTVSLLIRMNICVNILEMLTILTRIMRT